MKIDKNDRRYMESIYLKVENKNRGLELIKGVKDSALPFANSKVAKAYFTSVSTILSRSLKVKPPSLES